MLELLCKFYQILNVCRESHSYSKKEKLACYTY